MEDYRVIKGSLSGVAARVNELLAEGYFCIGGISAQVVTTGRHPHFEVDVKYLQAMVRPAGQHKQEESKS